MGGARPHLVLVDLPPPVREVRSGRVAIVHALPGRARDPIEAGRGLPQGGVQGAQVVAGGEGGDVRERIQRRGQVPAEGRPLRDHVHAEVVHLGAELHVGDTRLGVVDEAQPALAEHALVHAVAAVVVHLVAHDLGHARVDEGVDVVAVGGRGVGPPSPLRVARLDDLLEARGTIAVTVVVPALRHARRTGVARRRGETGLCRAGASRVGIRIRVRVAVDIGVGIGVAVGIRVRVGLGRTGGRLDGDGGRAPLGIAALVAGRPGGVAGQHHADRQKTETHWRYLLEAIVHKSERHAPTPERTR